ncbi:hypothetical protein SAMN04488118_11568 [Epibacterium ulvae]|uniref:Uncharacterized protein n=1 Tax=Epibacterium ulvae TaxID=1156985 RepID=A0A1G5RI25_9RHOB|nr:hypothetical protein SAMN04488118_11568 [Epibacterium ulvae]
MRLKKPIVENLIRRAEDDAVKSQTLPPSEPCLLERIESIQQRVEEMGLIDPNFDMKTFTDDLWDG